MTSEARGIRAWLVSAALLGAAQQVFVVLRNPFLESIRLGGAAIGWVQASGGAAGIVAGAIGLRAFGRISWRAAFALGVVANALGFAIQASASNLAVFVGGSAVAGLGIQAITMTAAPFLSETTTPETRDRTFAMHALFIQGVPGAVGAIAGGAVERSAARVAGSPFGFRVALASTAGLAAFALLPVLVVRGKTMALGTVRAREILGFAKLLVSDVLLFFAQGLVVPFLQLYFVVRFRFPSDIVGRVFALALMAGVVAQIAMPRTAKRVGAIALVLASGALVLPQWLALAFAPSAAWAIAAFTVRQALAMGTAPLLSSFLHHSVNEEQSARLAATRMIALSIAWASANVVGGQLLERDPSFHLVLLAAFGAHVTGLACAFAFYPRLRQRPTRANVASLSK